MERYTRKDAERAFLRLCKACGQRPAASYSDHGAWTLDNYQGFLVEQISDEPSCGVSQPFGAERHSAREFCMLVTFTIRAMEIAKGS